jgi:hypothetical protein
VAFDERGYLLTAHADGPLIESERRVRVEKAAADSPTITLAEVSRMLQAESAGLPIGDSDAPARILTAAVQNLSPFLGSVRVQSVRFSLDAKKDLPPGAASSRLLWLMSVEASQAGGTSANYWLTFEPFDGRLIDVVRQESR